MFVLFDIQFTEMVNWEKQQKILIWGALLDKLLFVNHGFTLILQ